MVPEIVGVHTRVYNTLEAPATCHDEGIDAALWARTAGWGSDQYQTRPPAIRLVTCVGPMSK